jgi:hypothetical protein
MAKTSRGAGMPGAWVVSPKDRGRKSIKLDKQSSSTTKGKVYLTDGEEFQIELYNPTTQCVLADIKLNGNPISKSGLVLRPGERFYLDCFIDDKKKFVFSTYEVEDTEESAEATASNGMLEVFFYKESVINVKDWRKKFEKVIVERHYYPYNPWPNTTIWTSTPNIYCGTSTGDIIGQTTFTTNGLGNLTTGSAYYSQPINVNTSGTISLNSATGTLSVNSASIETGRVEKGAESSQKFDEIDMEFDSYHIASTTLQLLPESRRPVETKEIRQESPKKQPDAIELIKKLAELKDAGILTEEEFSEKKAELLGRI